MLLRGLADLSGAQRWRFYHALIGFACVAAAALIGRTAGDSLFLTHFEARHLTYMYPVSASVAGVLAYGYGLLACRLPLARLISLAVGLLLILLLALRALLVFDGPEARVAAYVVGDLVVNTPMLLFWSFAGRLFDPRSAKRLFGLVGAGGTVACLVAGLTVSPLASAIGTPNLLWPVIALLSGFLLTVRRVARHEGVGHTSPRSGRHPGVRQLPTSAQIRPSPRARRPRHRRHGRRDPGRLPVQGLQPNSTSTATHSPPSSGPSTGQPAVSHWLFSSSSSTSSSNAVAYSSASPYCLSD